MVKDEYMPRLIAFEVTRHCRYACPHCRANAGPQIKQKELTTKQCKRILDAIAELNQCTVILTGGEPMERKDIFELIHHGHSLGHKMVMATCGYLFNEDTATKLKEAGLCGLSFSIDGASAETNDKIRQTKGALDTTLKAVEIVKQAGLRFQINTTISKMNADEVPGIAELARRLGAHCFNPFILVPTGRGKKISDQILDPIEYEAILNELLQLKLSSDIKIRVTCAPALARIIRQQKLEHLKDETPGCMGARGFGFISWQGDVQICGFLDISAGNLLENRYNLKKIWTESRMLNIIRDRTNITESCEFIGVCGGCRARAYAVNGDYLAADPACDYQKSTTKQ